jgi:hypothetical protein
MIRRLSLFLASTVLLTAAESGVDGPKLGYVFDSNQSAARVVRGIPGSSTIGDAIATGLTTAVISPSQAYLIGTTGDSRDVVIVTTADAALKPLAGVAAAPDLIVLSPKGSAAVFFHNDGSRAQLVKGLPSNPEIAGDFGTYSAASQIAISDDAERMLQVTKDGDVYSFTTDGNSRRLDISGVISTAFLAGSREALLVQGASGDITESADLTVIASVPDASAIVAFDQNRKAVVASGPSGKLTVLNLQDGSKIAVDCSCTPNILQPMAGDALFRVTELSAGPTWILNAALATPQLTFVPATGGANE